MNTTERDTVLDIVAMFVGRSSNIYRYIERDIMALETGDQIGVLYVAERDGRKANVLANMSNLPEGEYPLYTQPVSTQIEEVKAILRELLEERQHRTTGDLITLADRCRHLSRGDRDCIAMRGTLIDGLDDDIKKLTEKNTERLEKISRLIGKIDREYVIHVLKRGGNGDAGDIADYIDTVLS